MAEVVECRQERRLPEYNQMRKIQLFSDNEIRLIIKTRESFEYKIGKQSKVIKDFCEYIAYERNLLTTINERSKNRNLEQRKTNIVYSLTNHIKTLYKQALSRFPEEQRIWDQLFKFCKSSKLFTEVSAGFEKMLQFHSDKPHVWLRAVMWEYHDMHNMEKVSDLLLRGIQRHPNNSELYIEFFKIMLNEASTKSNECILQNNQASEQSLELERVFVIYESAKKKIYKIEFFVELLNIAEEYTFTRSLQKRIVEDMMSSFSRDEILWDKLAQRELLGFHMSELLGNFNETNNDIKSLENKNSINTGELQRPLTKTLRRRIELCVEVYENALKELKTEKMWSLYINAMLELNRDVSTQQILKRKMLGAAFKGAHEANFMSETHYLHYIELLMSSDIDEDYKLSVMQKATTIHSGSVHLWELWMRYHIIKNEEDKVYQIFRKSIKKLAFEAHPLWRILLQYYETRADLQNKMEDIFKEAINQNSQVFAPFKPQYIEWIAITKSMNAARKAYNELALNTSCLEFHQKMGSLESMQLKPDIKSWRKSHEFATQHFGKDRTDVWINYIKFERDHGEAKNMNFIFERAKIALNPDLIDNFISEHCIFTKGIV